MILTERGRYLVIHTFLNVALNNCCLWPSCREKHLNCQRYTYLDPLTFIDTFLGDTILKTSLEFDAKTNARFSCRLKLYCRPWNSVCFTFLFSLANHENNKVFHRSWKPRYISRYFCMEYDSEVSFFFASRPILYEKSTFIHSSLFLISVTIHY